MVDCILARLNRREAFSAEYYLGAVQVLTLCSMYQINLNTSRVWRINVYLFKSVMISIRRSCFAYSEMWVASGFRNRLEPVNITSCMLYLSLQRLISCARHYASMLLPRVSNTICKRFRQTNAASVISTALESAYCPTVII